jgi:hypothetical protein
MNDQNVFEFYTFDFSCYTQKMNFPKPTQKLWQMLGPSVVFVALSLNGGEMLLWPNLIATYGITILWVVPFILLMQAVVNLEIARLTVITGQNTLLALTRQFKWLKPFFLISIMVSLLWPAWISTSGNLLSVVYGNQAFGPWLALCMMLSLSILWLGGRSYQWLENITRVGLILVLVIALYVLFGSESTVVRETYRFIPDYRDSFLFVSGLAFGGVSGVLNLVQSDWVAKKNYGNSNGTLSKLNLQTEISKNNFKQQWKLIRSEHIILFIGGNFLGILLIGLVAQKTLPIGSQGFSLLSTQVAILGQLGFWWGLGIVVLFLMAQATILDAAGRLLSQLAPILNNRQWSLIMLGIGACILCITALNPSFNQPDVLLKLSAVLSAAIFAIYPPFILQLHKDIPEYMRPTLLTKTIVYANSIFYGSATLWVLMTLFVR